MKEVIHIDPETGEVEEESKLTTFLNKHIVSGSVIAAVLGVVVGTIGALIAMKKNEEEEEDENDAGEE